MTFFLPKKAAQTEQIQQIPIADLHPFKNHPFKVLDDEAMQRTVESVAQFGVWPRWLSDRGRKEAMRLFRATGGSTPPSWQG